MTISGRRLAKASGRQSGDAHFIDQLTGATILERTSKKLMDFGNAGPEMVGDCLGT